MVGFLWGLGRISMFTSLESTTHPALFFVGLLSFTENTSLGKRVKREDDLFCHMFFFSVFLEGLRCSCKVYGTCFACSRRSCKVFAPMFVEFHTPEVCV